MSGGNSVDLAELIDHYNTVKYKLSPFFEFWKGLERARKWENYTFSCFVVLSSVAVVLFPRTAVNLLSGAMLFVLILGRNYLTSKPHQVVTEEAKMVNQDAEAMLQNYNQGKRRRKHLAEFRKLLRHADNILIRITESFDFLIRIFKWENPTLSRRVCVLLLVICLSSIWMSLNLMLATAAIAFFCFNQDFKESTRKKMSSIRQGLSNKFRSASFPRLRSPMISLPRPPSFQWRVQPTNAETSSEKTWSPNAHSSLRKEPTQDNQSSTTSEPHSQPSVGRTDTAASSTTEQTGNSVSSVSSSKVDNQCSNCGASFSSFLKRKHCCNKCGLLFCGSCTVKVTRASLGATAPAALVETVRVCQPCKIELDSDRLPKTHATATIALEPANRS